MTKLAVAVLALASLTTGCINMSTKRPSGGSQIQRTSSQSDRLDPLSGDQGTFERRSDLGER